MTTQLDLTSIPKLISKYGSMRAVSRATGIVSSTILRYQFDYNCENHIIVNGALMTARVSTSRFVRDKRTPDAAQYKFVDNQLVKVEL